MKRGVSTVLMCGALIGAASPSAAFTYIDWLYGTPQLGISPRSRAMGGAGAALGNGAYSLVDNPATLAFEPGSRIQLQGNLARLSEDRMVPLYDTFDGFVALSAVAVNDHNYPNLSGGAVFELKKSGIMLAAGIYDRYDPRYTYEDERRSTDFPPNRDRITSSLMISEEGMLQALSVGAAVPFSGKRFEVGAAVNYYFGTFTNSVDTVFYDVTGAPGSADQEQLERSLDGLSFTLGVAAHVSERISVGLAFETPPQLSQDATLTSNSSPTSTATGDLDLPLRVQGGVIYHPRNTFQTTFAADLVFMPWSELKDDLLDVPAYEDAWQVRFGLEHIFYNKLPGRIGFSYGNSYALPEADNSVFTFGFGYLTGPLRLDLAGEVFKRNSYQDPFRPHASEGPYIGEGDDVVQDSMVRVTIGADYAF
jgi:hypothetical protein